MSSKYRQEDETRSMKEYFLASETVSSWWTRERWSPVLSLYFDEQLAVIESSMQWAGKLTLDVGTGFGRVAGALAARQAKAVGIDISREMIDVARSHGLDPANPVVLVRGDAEEMPFKDNRFDAVICIETLMHLPNPGRAVRELARVVRPGGVLFLGINNRFSLVTLINGIQLHRKVHGRLLGRPVVHRTATVRQLRSWISHAGLVQRDEIGIGLLHPEVALAVWPGRHLPLIPAAVAARGLSLERRCGLAHSWMRHAMKAIVLIAEKPGGQAGV
jgi:2-polyprenyl-6-hydroxyphenyl methylase / 3-demethylubiquinone-9 3-methyltransferase